MAAVPVDPGATPRHRPGAVLEQTADDIVLRLPEHRLQYALNPIAFALWELCDGETTVEEMIAAACDLFEADPDVVRRDVLTVVTQLTDAELLMWVGPDEATPTSG